MDNNNIPQTDPPNEAGDTAPQRTLLEIPKELQSRFRIMRQIARIQEYLSLGKIGKAFLEIDWLIEQLNTNPKFEGLYGDMLVNKLHAATKFRDEDWRCADEINEISRMLWRDIEF